MNRRRTIVAGLAGMLAAPPIAFAQKPQKVARIGYLTGGTSAATAQSVQAFRGGLRELGYVEGKNVIIEFRIGEGERESVPRLAAELVRRNPDCILATGYVSVQSLQRLTTTIPIVIGNIDADPVREGIVASYARPGGNVTGLTGIAWELAGKRIELLREIAPSVQRVAVLFDPRGRAGYSHVEGTQEAAKKLGIELHLLEAAQAEDVDRAFRTMRARGAEAVSMVHTGRMGTQRARIVELVRGMRLPAIYSSIYFVLDGGLMAYAPDTAEQFRRAAVFVDKILKGAKPADLPIEQPTKFELVVNMRTARALGITVPQTILIRAERVIE